MSTTETREPPEIGVNENSIQFQQSEYRSTQLNLIQKLLIIVTLMQATCYVRAEEPAASTAGASSGLTLSSVSDAESELRRRRVALENAHLEVSESWAQASQAFAACHNNIARNTNKDLIQRIESERQLTEKSRSYTQKELANLELQRQKLESTKSSLSEHEYIIKIDLYQKQVRDSLVMIEKYNKGFGSAAQALRDVAAKCRSTLIAQMTRKLEELIDFLRIGRSEQPVNRRENA